MRTPSSLVNWMPNNRPRMTMNPPGLFPFVLSRLFDHELRILQPYAETAEIDGMGECYRRMKEPPLTLPHVRAGAERVFGPTSRFDPHKGSFSFPLMLSGATDAGPVRYAMHLRDLRGGMDLPLFRLHDQPFRGPGAGQPDPTAVELSTAELSLLTSTIIEILEFGGAHSGRIVGPFCHFVPSEMLIYGYLDDEFFAESHQRREDYDHAVPKFAERAADAQRQRQQDAIDALFASCGSPVLA